MYSRVAHKGINLLGIIWANFANVNVSKQTLLLVWEKCFVLEFLWILMFDVRWILMKVISLGAETMCVSQGIYVQQDQVKVVYTL